MQFERGERIGRGGKKVYIDKDNLQTLKISFTKRFYFSIYIFAIYSVIGTVEDIDINPR